MAFQRENRGDRRQGAYPGFVEPALASAIGKVPAGERGSTKSNSTLPRPAPHHQ